MTLKNTLVAGLPVSIAMDASLKTSEITDQFDAACKSYKDGELRAAVQSLQIAVAEIQEKVSVVLLKLLPESLDGWSADEAQATTAGMAAMITGTNLSRNYHREDGANVKISITADSPFLSMMTMMLSNPMMLQTDPRTRIFTHAGRRGVIRQDEGSSGWEINLAGNGGLMIQVSGANADRETVESYLKAINIDAVEKAFSG